MTGPLDDMTVEDRIVAVRRAKEAAIAAGRNPDLELAALDLILAPIECQRERDRKNRLCSAKHNAVRAAVRAAVQAAKGDCPCGRPAGHPGQCWFRRRPKGGAS